LALMSPGPTGVTDSRTAVSLLIVRPECGCCPRPGPCRQDWMNASRSGLRTSACVVSMPCG
jgi:hypothetical protein